MAGILDHARILAAGALMATALLTPRWAPGTVQEQRARLPEPAQCGDPVQGTWKSHTYSAIQGQWTEFRLTIHRVPGSATELTGQIHNHSWAGDADDVQPGPCKGQLRYEISMDAKGTIVDNEVSVWGLAPWRVDKEICTPFVYGYNLDHFSGTIDQAIQEFQSVNNDGGMAINEPTVFRRIGCLDELVNPDAKVDPPPFTPPRVGCGCG